MSFRITGLSSEPFEALYGKPSSELARLGIERHVADAGSGFPDRVSLRDAQPGESLLLLNFEHQPASTPYRSRHAIYVIEGERRRFDAVDTVPAVLRSRMLSLRGFDERGTMRDADLADGREVEALIERLFANEDVAYVHVHFAKRGCYAARVDRV